MEIIMCGFVDTLLKDWSFSINTSDCSNPENYLDLCELKACCRDENKTRAGRKGRIKEDALCSLSVQIIDSFCVCQPKYVCLYS